MRRPQAWHHVQVSWQRVRAANMLATGGREWEHYLNVDQSGTYNNQYMVCLCPSPRRAACCGLCLMCCALCRHNAPVLTVPLSRRW